MPTTRRRRRSTSPRKILIAVGLKASIDQIVPAMVGQLQAQLLQMHPEMGKPLHETLVALLPEFNKGEDDVFTDTARALASRLSEAELQQTLAYFESPAGKKYTRAQAARARRARRFGRGLAAEADHRHARPHARGDEEEGLHVLKATAQGEHARAA